MQILVACEESQAVTIEMRKLGHEAYSCDLIECSGGHPEWHIQQSVSPLLNGCCTFRTADGEPHEIAGKWDMILAFPPCTYLTIAGNRWFDCVQHGYKAQNRWNDRCIAICFFLAIAYADCDRIAIENPIGVMSTYYRKPDQVIQPWQFGHGETKATCLWLKGLPLLEPTNVVEGREQRIWKMSPSKERARLRSKTFPGIAKAMSAQWGGDIRDGEIDGVTKWR